MHKPVVLRARPDGDFEVDIPVMSGEEGFEKLVQFLTNEYGAIVTYSANGPDAKRWFLSIEGVTIFVDHDDPYGNSILSSKEARSVELVKRIGRDLEQRLGHL
jgi:hypothetical protein